MTEDVKQEPEFRLDARDLQSPTWAKLRRHYEARLQRLRVRNDEPNLDPVKTAMLRGEIREVRNLLALGNPAAAPAMVADDDQGY